MKSQITRRARFFHLSRSLAAMLLVTWPHLAFGALVLEFGDPSTLLPVSNFDFQPNEVRNIALLVNNTAATEQVSGFTLELEIGGGGVARGGVVGPQFTGVDVTTGTPFALDHQPPTVNGGDGSYPQWLGLSLTTASTVPPGQPGTVGLPSGRTLLGTLTVSAAGFTTPQTWNLEYYGVGSSSFFNDAYNNEVYPTAQNSTVSVVPEPQDFALVMAVGLSGFAVWRRRIASNVCGQPTGSSTVGVNSCVNS